MFFEVSSLTYHSPITVGRVTCGTHTDEHQATRQTRGVDDFGTSADLLAERSELTGRTGVGQFSCWSGRNNHMRQPKFIGLREDKNAKMSLPQ